MKRVTLIDTIICIGALLLVVVTLAPAVARLQRTPEDAKCQSNMRRWGEALALYASDHERCYPTNRLLPHHIMVPQAMLSPKEYDENGNPIRFTYSINWVEALYPYLIAEAKETDRNWESFLKCPNASDVAYPPMSKTSRVSYAFNYNLLEFSPALVRRPGKTMMMREMDRLMEAVCRPINNSTGSPDAAPMSPFLTEHDYMIRGTVLNNTLHGQGSHILFADGHTAYFTADYFPVTLNASENWDPETGQWWNRVNINTEINKAIAITP